MLKLTLSGPRGDPIYINPAQIVAVTQVAPGESVVYATGDKQPFFVRETAEQVIEMMNDAAQEVVRLMQGKENT